MSALRHKRSSGSPPTPSRARETAARPTARPTPPKQIGSRSNTSWRRSTRSPPIEEWEWHPALQRSKPPRHAISSGLDPSTGTSAGSSAMPQIGQLPGSPRTISGCIGQVQRVPAVKESRHRNRHGKCFAPRTHFGPSKSKRDRLVPRQIICANGRSTRWRHVETHGNSL